MNESMNFISISKRMPGTTASSDRAKIQLLFEDGNSERHISLRLKIPKSTVHDIIQSIKKNGSCTPKKSPGRPRKTSARTDKRMKRAAVENPSASSAEIRGCLPVDIRVSSRTIRRRLKDIFCLRSFRAASKPKLSVKNIQDRLNFCNAHKNWTIEMWRKVLFTDETQIKQFCPHIPMVRRPKNERFNPKYVVSTVKKSPAIMIWGSISGSGRAGIHIMPQGKLSTQKLILAYCKKNFPCGSISINVIF